MPNTHQSYLADVLAICCSGDLVHQNCDVTNGVADLHGLFFTINSKDSFICTIPDRIAHTTACVTSVMEHWMKRKIAQWVRWLIAPRVNALTMELHLAPQGTSYLQMPVLIKMVNPVNSNQIFYPWKLFQWRDASLFKQFKWRVPFF